MERKNFELAAKILFFGTLEESFAIEHAKKLANIKSRPLLLSEIWRVLDSKKKKKFSSVQFDKGLFSFPVGVDFSFWREFKFHSSAENFNAVLLKWIGGLSNAEISKIFAVSEGALEMRYNKGLKLLGSFLIKERASEL